MPFYNSSFWKTEGIWKLKRRCRLYFLYTLSRQIYTEKNNNWKQRLMLISSRGWRRQVRQATQSFPSLLKRHLPYRPYRHLAVPLRILLTPIRQAYGHPPHLLLALRRWEKIFKFYSCKSSTKHINVLTSKNAQAADITESCRFC